MSEHNYTIKYQVEMGSFSKEELKEAGAGGCDKIILMSIVEGADGSRSQLNISQGPDGELPSFELWKAWAMTAHELSQKEDLEEGKRNLCGQVFEIIRQSVMAAREKDERCDG